ncbi:MAG: BREX-1 system adenine-specific DNA-methyltransferase PglX [Clostridia bacterium]|nr:BREX-1 system adenine-specific DNA-methyltransferase PglX [Clostridia bacterium]
MDKAILKKFAIESRQDLMSKIKNKINTYYIDEEFTKEQKGDLYILSNSKHSLSLTNEEYKKRELLIKRIKELSPEQVIEEAAYTWFNRIIAIRYMEINDMLPLTRDNQSLGIRVLSSKDNTPDPEILKFTNLMNPELDIEFKKEKYAELKDDNEKFKYILLLVCKKLGRVIPQVFDGITDYIDILIPDNLLNDTGFITKVINEVPENNYNQVEIIGWLYQYYISERKDEVFADLKKNIKIKKENIPSATQIFTPDWIVKYLVQNTLGRYASNTYRKKLKYYVSNDSDTDEKVDIRNIKFFDPCCGSGHILVYAFEMFYELYLEYGFNKKEVAELILKNNIFGLDIDDRAGQLSILSLLLKAREIDKNIFNKDIVRELNITSIQETNSLNRTSLDNIYNEKAQENASYLIDTFINAKEIGSILKVENRDYSELITEINNNNTIFGIELQRYIPIIKCAKILSQKYDVVVTNPPYMGNKGMSEKLSRYVKDNYDKYKSDLYSVFIRKCREYTKEYGFYGMITQPTFLFISTYEELRKSLVLEQNIYSLLHMGRGIFGIDFGSSAFVVQNDYDNNFRGEYFRLNKRTFQFIELKDIEKMFLNAKDDYNYKFDFDKYKAREITNENESIEEENIEDDTITGPLKIHFAINQNKFIDISGCPIAYWLNDKYFSIFKEYPPISEYGNAKQGLATADNNRFLRFWYEVNNNDINFNCKKTEDTIESKIKWYPYNKGGFYRKWYGNNEYVVNWQFDGKEIKNFFDGSGKLKSRPQNTNYYFKEGITWSLISSTNFGTRYVKDGFIFDVNGMTLFLNDENKIKYFLGFMNTSLNKNILNIINPTMAYQSGDILKIPLKYNDKILEMVSDLVDECISISKEDWDSFETSWDFKTHPLIYESNMNPKQIKKEESNGFQVCNNLKEAYVHWDRSCNNRCKDLKDKEEKLNRIFIDNYGLNDDMSPEIMDKDITVRKADRERDIKSLLSYAVGCMFGRYSLDEYGIVYAGGTFNKDNYKLFKADEDNIIPITDEAYFGDDIVERFKSFIRVAFGTNTFNENMDFIAEALGKKGTETSEDAIRRYFLNDFFNDHVKIYQKRPIYWLFDSGKKNGFKALVYMHRYNENLIPKIRLDYLHRIQTTYEKLLSDVNYKLTTELSMSDKKAVQNKQVDLNAKLQEIKEYDEKIAHIANQRISIDLDDGVKENYDKFKDILAKIK